MTVILETRVMRVRKRLIPRRIIVHIHEESLSFTNALVDAFEATSDADWRAMGLSEEQLNVDAVSFVLVGMSSVTRDAYVRLNCNTETDAANLIDAIHEAAMVSEMRFDAGSMTLSVPSAEKGTLERVLIANRGESE